MISDQLHPEWCDLPRCTARPDGGGGHKSEPATVDLGGGIVNLRYQVGQVKPPGARRGILTAHLGQAATPQAPPFVSVAVADVTLFLPVRAARRVAGAVWDVADLADGAQ